MNLKIIDKSFAICKIQDLSKVNFNAEYYFLSKTDTELSLVCTQQDVPQNATHIDTGWKAFRIEGTLDFSLIGILSKIFSLLAENQIGIFAISTYNTDYILTKLENFEKAIEVLVSSGYRITK